jgi:hypothetical protein
LRDDIVKSAWQNIVAKNKHQMFAEIKDNKVSNQTRI